MHNLIPHFIAEQYQAGNEQGEFPAVTLFLDISGFTAMTQALMQYGKAGAETLADIINRVFDPIINAIYDQGGFITGFAGDALTAVFPQRHPTAPVTACQAALTIRQTFADRGQQQTNLGDFSLAVKQGLACGAVEWGIVGSNEQKSYFFRGPAIDGCAQAEQRAVGGKIIVDRRLEGELPAAAVTLQPLDERYARLIRGQTKRGVKRKRRPLPTTSPTTAGQFFPPALWSQVQQGEFRDVATLFLSFEGSSDRAALDHFVAQVLGLVRRLEGHFAEIDFGDKGGLFVVYFGAPSAHENDVERALDFALALRSESAVGPWAWRAGITFGMVYAGYVGIPRRDKYTCMGSSMNLAARLMMQARWGEVLVSQAVAAHPRFDFVALGPLPYKGFAQPLPTYRLAGKTLAERIFVQEMVGRDQELQKLVAFAQPLLAGRRAGAALIYGEAGIGKSHLTYALSRALGAQVRWLKGESDPTLHEAFHPFVYFLKEYFGQSAAATEAQNKASFTQRLHELLTAIRQLPNTQRQHDELVRTQSFLGALLDLYWPDSLYEQLDAEGRYRNAMIAVSMLLQAECRRQPVVLELEDGHWLDESSRELLTAITRQLGDFPLLIVLTSRYADDGTRPEYGLAPTIPTMTVDLAALPAAALRELAQAIVGTPIDEHLHAVLLAKTQANPFFAQQILYYLQENELLQVKTVAGQAVTGLMADTFDLPTSLNSLLVARLDRLTPTVKEVVQTAAVLGREFESRLLTHMLERDLTAELGAAEREQIWRVLGALQYIFKHTLLRDAAYEMQLRARLREVHYLAAVTGEWFYAEQLPVYYGSLAYHYETAYLLGQAEAGERARHYLWQAGEQAAANFENGAAVGYFSRALALTPEDDVAERYALYRAREQTYNVQGNRQAQSQDLEWMAAAAGRLSVVEQATAALRRSRYAEATSDLEAAASYAQAGLALAQAGGQGELVAFGHSCCGWTFYRQGRFDAANPQFISGLQLAQAAQNKRIMADCLRGLGNVAWYRGEYEVAQTHYEQSLALCREGGDRRGAAMALGNMGSVASDRSEYGTARTCHEQALALFREVGDRRGEGISLTNLGVVTNDCGDYGEAIAYLEQALAICHEVGERSGEGMILNNLGVVANNRGDYGGALAYLGQALALCREIGDQGGEGLTLSNLGWVHVRLGQWETAGAHSQEAVALARKVEAHYVLGEALTHLGHAQTALGQLAEAQAHYQEAYTLQQEAGLGDMTMEPLAGLARVALAQNEPAQALAHGETIHAYLAERELSGAAEDPMWVYWTCYQVLQAAGDSRAAPLLRRAYARVQAMAAKQPEEMRAAYLAIPSHAGIVEAWSISTPGRPASPGDPPALRPPLA